jgi:hypothetical protein
MGTTANRLYPWPAGSVLAGLADTHIKALADAVDVDVDALLDAQVPDQRVRAFRLAALNIATATWTLIPWDDETYDVGALHTAVGNPSRLVAPATGLYRFDARVAYPVNAAGMRAAQARLNAAGAVAGGTEVERFDLLAGGSPYQPAVKLGQELLMTAGQYLEVFTYQNSGGNLALDTLTYGSWASLRRLR